MRYLFVLLLLSGCDWTPRTGPRPKYQIAVAGNLGVAWVLNVETGEIRACGAAGGNLGCRIVGDAIQPR